MMKGLSYLIVTFCFTATVWANDTHVYDRGSLFSQDFTHFIEKQSQHIEEISTIKILVITGTESNIVRLQSENIIGVYIHTESVTIFTSPDLKNLISDINEEFLIKESQRSLEMGNPREAMEFLFINFVDLIAREKELSMDELLVIQRYENRTLAFALISVFAVIITGVVYLFKREKYNQILDSECFGGTLLSKQPTFNGSIDT